MVLLSPGTEVTITDETIGLPAATGTVPLIIIATANNKLSSDGTTIAPGTVPTLAGTLHRITSQRELLQNFGNPFFEKNTKDGEVVQGSEINEYGLHAAFSYLGVASQAFVIRSDIALDELAFSQSEPRGPAVNGTYWFDTDDTIFGGFRSNGNANAGLAWDRETLLRPLDTEIDSGFVPLVGFGVDGDLAIVTQTTDNKVFEKISGSWELIGTTAWKAARPTVTLGSVSTPTVTNGDNLTIIGTTVIFVGTTLADVKTSIDGASIPGISVDITSGALQIALATGEDITLSSTGSAMSDLGLTPTTSGFNLIFDTHINVPDGSHAGDIWFKTTDPNFGASYIVRRFSSSTGQFELQATPLFDSDASADAALSTSKVIGSLYIQYNTIGTIADPIATSAIKRWDGTTWIVLVYEAKPSEPDTDAPEGTLWISDEFKVDIMVNDGDEWKGYLNKFPTTDPAGVLLTSAEPSAQSDGTPLVVNDLWIDTSDLDNYPAIRRFDGTSFVLIDNTDETTPNGIVFADARERADGTLTGSEAIADLLISDFADADTLNPQTFPVGMLLFNTRFSTFNVKVRRTEFFKGQGSYTVGIAVFSSPADKARWVNLSGNDFDGSPFMGRFAQHRVVVTSLAAILVSNDEIRSEANAFNLISAPGYPELIDEMQTLNIDRKETAFIIADIPLRLAPDATSIGNWANNAANVPGTSEFGRTTRYTFSAEYYPHGLSTNVDGTQVLVPSSTLALRAYAASDAVSFEWFPPAGTRRGTITNATAVGFLDNENEFKPVVLNQGQRDVLFTNNINPNAFIAGRGLFLFGDKTLHPENSALDRVNVARLVAFLRRRLDEIAQPFLFQLNTEATRDAIKQAFDRFFIELIAAEALTDFIVVSDLTNNTPERIDRNELHVDIAFAPTKSINFIFIPVRIVRTDDPSLSG